MKLPIGLGLVLSAVVAYSLPSAAQVSEPVGAASAAPIALVYVQVTKGVNVYSESAAGKLTLLNGSPFKISGQMEGITGSHLLSVGTTVLHSYQLASNGSVGAQIASANTATYDSHKCGPTTGNKAMLDHSGKYFYVQLSGPEPTTCQNSGWQTYQIGSNGDFTFIGDYYPQYFSPTTAPVFNSSDKYGYGFAQLFLDGQGGFAAFTRKSNGVLELNSSFTEKDPAPDTGLPDYLQPFMATADAQEHLAVVMQPCYNGGPCSPYPENLQLASYTINASTGGISSTNTQKNAPYLDFASSNSIDMSEDGKFVAVGGSGFDLFNFNGASVPTKLGSLKISGVQVDQLAWDKADHLFALSYAAKELDVFNVSAAHGAVEIGEPLLLPGPYGVTGIIVIDKQ